MIRFNTEAEVMEAINSGRYFKGNTGPEMEDWYITMDLFNKLKNTELIQEDKDNRKTDWDDEWGGGIAEHVDAIVENFFPPAIGLASVSAATVDGKRILKLCDFHNRAASISDLETKHGDSWEKFKNYPVVLRIVREGLGGRMNAALNRQKAHSTRNKLLNKELAFGKIINAIFEDTKSYTSGFPKASWLQQLANGIYLKENDKLDSVNTYYEFLRTKKDTKPLIDIPKSKKIFSRHDDNIQKDLIVAVRATLETMELMRKYWSSKQRTGEINKELKKLLSSAYWFGFLFQDALKDRLIISRYDDDMADRIELRGAEFVSWVLNLETPLNEDHIRSVLRVYNKLSKKALRSTKGNKMYTTVVDEVLAKKELA